MNKKTLKKSLAGFMVVAVLSGTMAPAAMIFAADETRRDSDLVLEKLKSKQLEKVKELKDFDGEGKMKTFSADESLKKSADVKQTEKQNYVEGEVLVKFKEQKINLERSSGRMKAIQFAVSKNLDKKEDIRKSNISVLGIKGDESVEEMVEKLKGDTRVEYVEPNYKRYPTTIDTDDTYKDLLWGLDNANDKDIDAPEAWVISEGSENDVIVAVIDTGVAYNHPDLIANMWNGNSCVSDTGGVLGGCNHGYDYEDNDKTPLPTSDSHGTHVAGTIGAVKNNSEGIIGVAPNVKIMALKFGLDTSSEIKAINFAIQNEAKIINASYGGNTFSLSEYNAINDFRLAGGIFIAGAGNDANNNDGGTHFYPSDYDLDNIISVSATDQSDDLASFSNYGVSSIDVGAPGVNIYSTVSGSTIDGSVVFSEDFEGDTYNIGVGGDTAINWAVGFDGYSKVAYSDAYYYPYESNAHTWLIQDGTSDLSNSNISGATLGFTVWCDTPSSLIFDDYIRTFYYSNSIGYNSTKYDEDKIYLDGGSIRIDNGHTGYYKRYTENISDYLTNDFQFGFDWITDSSTDYNYGCTIDDIIVTKYTDGSDGNYDYADGTSMAAPHVAGLAALIWGYDSELSYSEVKNTILETGDSITSLAGKTTTGRRINAHEALLSLTDTTAPIRSNPSPTEELSSGTTETLISLDTDENATCRYSETAETAYSAMTDSFSTTGETTHSTTVTELTDGQSYTYYVRCEDETENPNTDDFPISFSVAETTNTPPVMESVTLYPDTVYTNTEITAVPEANDDNGDEIDFSYQWKKSIEIDYEFEDIAGETDSILSGDNFVKGNIIKVEVTPNDGTDDGDPMESDPITISNSIPTQPTVLIEPNPAYANNDLTCIPSGSTDADDNPFSYEHQWYKNGAAEEHSNTVLASNTTTGEIWKCEVVAYDGEDQSDAGESFVTISEAPDETPPIRSNPSPTWELPASTTETLISLNTDENAICKYSTTSGVAYDGMLNTFEATGGETLHIY